MTTAQQIFREFATDGVPASGQHDPVKAEIRAWGRALEAALAAANGEFGTDDAAAALVKLFGGGAGDNGGELRFHYGADYDGSDEYIRMAPEGDTFVIGRGPTALDLRITNAGTLITSGTYQPSASLGTLSSGTHVVTPTGGNIKHVVNGGAFTLSPPPFTHGSFVLEVTNNASAGVINTGGFSVVDGDALTTDANDAFMLFIMRTANHSYLSVKAMQ